MSLGDILNTVNELGRETQFFGVDGPSNYTSIDIRNYENGIWFRWRAPTLTQGGTYTLSFTEGDTDVFASSTPIPTSRLRIQQIATKSGANPLEITLGKENHTLFGLKKINHIISIAQSDTPKRFIHPVVTAAVGAGDSADIEVIAWGLSERTPIDLDALTET